MTQEEHDEQTAALRAKFEVIIGWEAGDIANWEIREIFDEVLDSWHE